MKLTIFFIKVLTKMSLLHISRADYGLLLRSVKVEKPLVGFRLVIYFIYNKNDFYDTHVLLALPRY